MRMPEKEPESALPAQEKGCPNERCTVEADFCIVDSEFCTGGAKSCTVKSDA